MRLTYTGLKTLIYHQTVNADDIAFLSGQNRVKGIHPIFHSDFMGVVILCTIGGISYANEWLNTEKTALKYFLEGRTDSTTGIRTFNPNITSNRAIIDSNGRYPILVFVRSQKGELFKYEGKFTYERFVQDHKVGYYFILKKEATITQEVSADDEFDITTTEGKLRLKVHMARERDPSIIRLAIQRAKRIMGVVKCEICDFDFEEKYGERGRNFIEGHHKTPLSDLDIEGGETKIDDIALVCANCHRIIHRKRPWLSMDQMIQLLKP